MDKRSLFTTQEVLVVQRALEMLLDKWGGGTAIVSPNRIMAAESALEKMVWGEGAAEGTTAHPLGDSDHGPYDGGSNLVANGSG